MVGRKEGEDGGSITPTNTYILGGEGLYITFPRRWGGGITPTNTYILYTTELYH
jgi:hypothetical protein